jgi:hypothetical protein
MRDALRQLSDGEYWVYGPSTHEFDNVVGLVQKYSDYADTCIKGSAESDDDVPEEFADADAEVSADLGYYNYIEKGLLWSFALWRIQGMFEALLVTHYLPSKPAKPLIGLRSKLEAVSAAGYSTATEHESELVAWGNLRNLLSHSPPEHYCPIAVDREDIEEYVSLLKAVCASWTEQRPLVCKK